MSLPTPSQSVSHKRFHQCVNHKKKLSLRHPLPTFGSFSLFQAFLAYCFNVCNLSIYDCSQFMRLLWSFVDLRPSICKTSNSEIQTIHKFIMKNNWIKQIFVLWDHWFQIDNWWSCVTFNCNWSFVIVWKYIIKFEIIKQNMAFDTKFRLWRFILRKNNDIGYCCYLKDFFSKNIPCGSLFLWTFLYSDARCSAHLPRCDAVIIIIDFSCTCLLLTMDKSMIQIMEFLNIWTWKGYWIFKL